MNRTSSAIAGNGVNETLTRLSKFILVPAFCAVVWSYPMYHFVWGDAAEFLPVQFASLLPAALIYTRMGETTSTKQLLGLILTTSLSYTALFVATVLLGGVHVIGGIWSWLQTPIIPVTPLAIGIVLAVKWIEHPRKLEEALPWVTGQIVKVSAVFYAVVAALMLAFFVSIGFTDPLLMSYATVLWPTLVEAQLPWVQWTLTLGGGVVAAGGYVHWTK